MRFWVSGPRILGRRTGVSFGPEDFRQFGAARTSNTRSALSKARASAWIYVIKAANGHVKVGITADPLARLASLQTGSSQKLELVYACGVKSNDGFAVEQAAHAILWKHRLEGEWFDTTPDMAVAAIAAASHRLNDPIVEIPKDKIATVLAIAARQTEVTAIRPMRRANVVWFWATAPLLALMAIVAASDGAGLSGWLILALPYTLLMFGITRFVRASS